MVALLLQKPSCATERDTTRDVGEPPPTLPAAQRQVDILIGTVEIEIESADLRKTRAPEQDRGP